MANIAVPKNKGSRSVGANQGTVLEVENEAETDWLNHVGKNGAWGQIPGAKNQITELQSRYCSIHKS